MTDDDARPRVTVAIPLHRSAPFVDVVSANLERLPRHDVEILVSDRTGRDGALATLATRHRDDPRIRFLAADDGVGWVDHDNALLQAARGRYFMWMPHDDEFPADYVPLLAAALDAHPDALLAFGDIESIDLDGAPSTAGVHPPLPVPLGTLPRAREAATLLASWNLGILFRGLVRRDEILARRLTIRHRRHDAAADVAWGLAVVAAGPIVHVPACTCRKRYYPTSTHATWPAPTAYTELELVAVTARYLLAARVPAADTARLLTSVASRAVRRSSRRALSGLRRRVRPRLPAHGRDTHEGQEGGGEAAAQGRAGAEAGPPRSPGHPGRGRRRRGT